MSNFRNSKYALDLTESALFSFPSLKASFAIISGSSRSSHSQKMNSACTRKHIQNDIWKWKLPDSPFFSCQRSWPCLIAYGFVFSGGKK